MVSFAAGHTWTGDQGGDAGTYTTHGKKMTLTWTSGGDSPATFAGKYHNAAKDYTGSFGGLGAGFTGQLVKGAVSGC